MSPRESEKDDNYRELAGGLEPVHKKSKQEIAEENRKRNQEKKRKRLLAQQEKAESQTVKTTDQTDEMKTSAVNAPGSEPQSPKLDSESNNNKRKLKTIEKFLKEFNIDYEKKITPKMIGDFTRKYSALQRLEREGKISSEQRKEKEIMSYIFENIKSLPIGQQKRKIKEIIEEERLYSYDTFDENDLSPAEKNLVDYFKSLEKIENTKEKDSQEKLEEQSQGQQQTNRNKETPFDPYKRISKEEFLEAINQSRKEDNKEDYTTSSANREDSLTKKDSQEELSIKEKLKDLYKKIDVAGPHALRVENIFGPSPDDEKDSHYELFELKVDDEKDALENHAIRGNMHNEEIKSKVQNEVDFGERKIDLPQSSTDENFINQDVNESIQKDELPKEESVDQSKAVHETLKDSENSGETIKEKEKALETRLPFEEIKKKLHQARNEGDLNAEKHWREILVNEYKKRTGKELKEEVKKIAKSNYKLITVEDYKNKYIPQLERDFFVKEYRKAKNICIAEYERSMSNQDWKAYMALSPANREKQFTSYFNEKIHSFKELGLSNLGFVMAINAGWYLDKVRSGWFGSLKISHENGGTKRVRRKNIKRFFESLELDARREMNEKISNIINKGIENGKRKWSEVKSKIVEKLVNEQITKDEINQKLNEEKIEWMKTLEKEEIKITKDIFDLIIQYGFEPQKIEKRKIGFKGEEILIPKKKSRKVLRLSEEEFNNKEILKRILEKNQ